MVNRKIFALGVLSGLLLAGCAGVAYHYYGLEGVRYEEGKLTGPKPKDDRPFSDCAPSEKEKHPCVVMFRPEFYAFKQDYETCKQELKDCQKQVSSQ